MSSLKCHASPPPNPGMGVEGLCSQETSIKIVKASMSISDGCDYKGETKSSDTELLFHCFCAYSFNSSHAQLM